MNGALIKEQEKERAREAASRGYAKLLKELNNEEHAASGYSTIFGKKIRHKRNNGHMLLAGTLTLRAREAFLWASLLSENLSKGWEKLTETMPLLAHHWPSVKEQIAQSTYINVANTMNPDLTVAFAPVAVSAKVADILAQQIGQVKGAQTAIDARHAEQRFLGPFIEEKTVHELKDIFKIRHDPDSKCYGHCIAHVARLEQEFGEDDAPKTETAYIFGVIAAPQTSKGLKVGITADGEMTQNDLQVAEKAAPVISVPPHLKMVLG